MLDAVRASTVMPWELHPRETCDVGPPRAQIARSSMEVDDTVIQNPCYVQNPDVVLREEDPDGALLFNPDTNQVRAVNRTGLFVWKLCDGSQDLAGIVAAMKESFDQVPEQEVADQVRQYVHDMVTAGFIGTALE